MRTVHFVFGGADALYKRCVPVFPFAKDGLQFDENPLPDDGWLVVCNANRSPLLTHVPRSRRIFVVGESSVSHHPVTYFDQFGVLVSPFPVHGYQGRWLQSHPAVPWFFGATFRRREARPTIGYRDLADLPVPKKRSAVSAVVSTKVVHAGHRQRLRFLEGLKDRLGERLALFGRGFRAIDDKAEAILPFALHLALENTVEPHYRTEKLPDALLGYALPIYSGCPHLDQWLPRGAFETVDVARPGEAARRIAGLLDAEAWRERLPLIIEARRRVMEEDTVFRVVARAIGAFPDTAPRLGTPERVLPPARPPTECVAREMSRAFHRLTFRTRLRGDS